MSREARFESWVVATCDRFVSQRSFELIVEPALADLEFEEHAGRHRRRDARAAVLIAMAGAVGDDLRRGGGSFFKLVLLSAGYYLFPLAVSVSIFKTWSDFLVAVAVVLALSVTPVLVCFWPARRQAGAAADAS